MYSYGPPHMAELKQDDRLEHTYSSCVRIRDVAQKTCQRRWTIGKSGERGSGISVLAARHDDDDDNDDDLIILLVYNEYFYDCLDLSRLIIIVTAITAWVGKVFMGECLHKNSFFHFLLHQALWHASGMEIEFKEESFLTFLNDINSRSARWIRFLCW